MKIWYSPYELFPLGALNRFQKNPRRGFLIKIQTRVLAAGYADCHPLMEFGDGSVELLIKRLEARKPTPLLKRALHLAKIDGAAREEKRSLLTSQKVKSHYTCSDLKTLTSSKIEKIIEQGFSTVKVKVGSDVQLETHVLNGLPTSLREALRWRFDANCGDGEQFLKLLSTDFLQRTDFIEDPLPYKIKKWLELSKKYSIKCAFDRPVGAKKLNEYPGIRVLKPAREPVAPRRVDILTNSMDHPVGQSFALWAAQTAIKKFNTQPQDYGLQTAHLFKMNSFFEHIQTNTAYFRPSDGYGVGFDDLLEKMPWQSL